MPAILHCTLKKLDIFGRCELVFIIVQSLLSGKQSSFGFGSGVTISMIFSSKDVSESLRSNPGCTWLKPLKESMTKCPKCGGTEIATGRISLSSGHHLWGMVFEPEGRRYLALTIMPGTPLNLDSY